MTVHVSRKGLDLPILGGPEPGIHDHDPPRHVAPSRRRRIRPAPNDARGGRRRSSPGAAPIGRQKDARCPFHVSWLRQMVASNRGERRAFQSVVLELASADRFGPCRWQPMQVSFESFSGKSPVGSTREEVSCPSPGVRSNGRLCAGDLSAVSRIPRLYRTPSLSRRWTRIHWLPTWNK